MVLFDQSSSAFHFVSCWISGVVQEANSSLFSLQMELSSSSAFRTYENYFDRQFYELDELIVKKRWLKCEELPVLYLERAGEGGAKPFVDLYHVGYKREGVPTKHILTVGTIEQAHWVHNYIATRFGGPNNMQSKGTGSGKFMNPNP